MKLVITGANSFIGKYLAQAFVSEGHEIVVVMRQPCPDIPTATGIEPLFLNMDAYDRLGELAGPCDCLVHLAWNGTRGAARMDVLRQTENLDNSLAGVRSMLDVGCKRIVTAGSQAEYGPYAEQISEETPCHPNTAYGKAKLALYEQCVSLCHKSGAQLLEPRFFSLYGPGDFTGTMISNILKNMLANRPCDLTEGIQRWDFLYIKDAVEALSLLCTKDCPSGVYNLGSGDNRQLREYVMEIATLTGTQSALHFGSIPYPESGMVSLWPNVSKLKETLQWQPRTPFSCGVKALIAEELRDVMAAE